MFASAVLQSWGVPGGRGRNDQEFSAPPTPANFRQEREPHHRPELQTCRFSFPEMNFHSAGSVTCGDSPGSFSPPEMLRQVRSGYPPPSNPASGVSCPGLEMKVTAPSFDFSRGSPGILGAPKFDPHCPRPGSQTRLPSRWQFRRPRPKAHPAIHPSPSAGFPKVA